MASKERWEPMGPYGHEEEEEEEEEEVSGG